MKKRFNITIFAMVVAMIITMLTGQAIAGRCQIRVNKTAQLAVGPVCFADIAQVTSDDAELKDRIDRMIITRITPDSTDSNLGIFEISRCLRRAGINPISIDIYGASYCRLSPENVQLSLDQDVIVAQVYQSSQPTLLGSFQVNKVEDRITLADKLTEQVVLSTGLPADRLIIDWKCSEHDFLQQPIDENRFKIKPRSAVALGQVRFEIIDNNSPQNKAKNVNHFAKVPRKYYITGNVQYLCESVVAQRQLHPGQTITAADVKIVTRRITNLNRQGVDNARLLIGQEVARSIRAGQSILPSMVKKIILVKRNDYVDVITRSGGVQIKLTAKALMDGAYGETISVRDERKTVLRGRITGPGLVTIVSADDMTSTQKERIPEKPFFAKAGEITGNNIRSN